MPNLPTDEQMREFIHVQLTAYNAAMNAVRAKIAEQIENALGIHAQIEKVDPDPFAELVNRDSVDALRDMQASPNMPENGKRIIREMIADYKARTNGELSLDEEEARGAGT